MVLLYQISTHTQCHDPVEISVGPGLRHMAEPQVQELEMSELAADVEAQISADEALARRLQAEQHRVDSSTPLISSIWGSMRTSSGGSMNENRARMPPQRGNLHQPGTGPGEADDGPPIIGQVGPGGAIQVQAGEVSEEPAARRNVRMNMMEDGARGMNASRLGLLLLTMVNVPLIIAGVVVLTLHWQDDEVCDASHRQRWRWWALVSVVRMALITPVVVVRWKLEGQLDGERNAALDTLSNNMRNSLDIVGLIWFVIGNMWLMQNSGCDNASDSPIYKLCLVYIIITYVHIALPCILLMLLVPVICFCLPCVIRLLGMLQGPQRQKGARQEEIEKLELLKFQETAGVDNETCPICLVEYKSDDDLRKLPCSHAFHPQCVDNWLLVNASCPNCRARCFDLSGDGDEEKTQEAGPLPRDSLV